MDEVIEDLPGKILNLDLNLGNLLTMIIDSESKERVEGVKLDVAVLKNALQTMARVLENPDNLKESSPELIEQVHK